MKRSILILEGNKSLRYLITNLFTDKYKVIAVEDSNNAMAFFASGFEPDLIIMDVATFQSENLELLEHVSTSSILSKIPVVVLSSSRDEKLKNRCLESGVSEFLVKPFDPVHLVQKAAYLLRKSIPEVIHKRKIMLGSLNIF